MLPLSDLAIIHVSTFIQGGNMSEFLSRHYLALKINALEQYLSRSVKVSIRQKDYYGTSCVFYFYKDPTTGKEHRHLASSKTGQRLAKVYDQRKQKEMTLAQFRSLWNSTFGQPCPKLDLDKMKKTHSSFITQEMFDSLTPCVNPRKILRPNPYKGIIFRSKSERELAELLDELGIEYKYEPLLTIGGAEIFPDFVCFIRELGIGFIIEHFGMIDNIRYIESPILKFRTVTSVGMIPGIDILFTYERENAPPTTDYFRNSINCILDNICAP